jgi:acyl carrier protein
VNNDDSVPLLRSVVGEVTKRDASKLGPDDELIFALGLDSMEGLRVLALVEKRFGVRFDDAELQDLRTLRSLAEAVERRKR